MLSLRRTPFSVMTGEGERLCWEVGRHTMRDGVYLGCLADGLVSLEATL
jgi:hypothetical protein